MRLSARSTAPSASLTCALRSADSVWLTAPRGSSTSSAGSASPTVSVRSSATLVSFGRPCRCRGGCRGAGRSLLAVLLVDLGLRLGEDLLLHLDAEVLVVVRPEVRIDHALVAHHGVRWTLGDHLALGH